MSVSHSQYCHNINIAERENSTTTVLSDEVETTTQEKVEKKRKDDLHGENSIEDVVPDFARHSETKVEVLVMMSQVILLHFSHVGREASVVESARR